MKNVLFINGKDAYLTWHAYFDSSSMSALMTPAPMKQFVSNSSRLIDGEESLPINPRLDSREITLVIQFSANSESDFFSRYSSFCEELSKGRIEIKTIYQNDVVYRFDYIQCSQFSEFLRGIGKFTLKLKEPDPTDRGITSKY